MTRIREEEECPIRLITGHFGDADKERFKTRPKQSLECNYITYLLP